MRPMTVRPILVAIALLAASGATAADRYVATTGDDANPGTLAAPLRTLRQAYLASSAGDAIVIRAGTYNESLYIEKANLALRAYPGEAVTIAQPWNDPSLGNVITFATTGGGGSVTGLDISGGNYYPLMFMGSPGLAKSCHLHDAGYIGIKVALADDITIEDCEIDTCGLAMSGIGIDDVAGANLVVRRCHVHDVHGYDGIYIKGGASACLVEDCLVHDIDGSGITFGDGTDPQFMVNPPWENVNGVARNNIVYNCGAAAFSTMAALDPTFVNNTCWNVARTARGGIFVVAEGTCPTTGLVCRNNIVGVTSGRVSVLLGSGGYASMTATDNCFAPNAIFEDDNTPLWGVSLATWRATLGLEQASFAADPLLDATWHLQAGSPCIDAGYAATSVTTDYDGQARPSGAGWDIGADEAVAADTTPPTITGVGASAITTSAATIAWTTDEPADGQIDYGTTSGYGASTTLMPSLTTSHQQSLGGLAAGTTYHYRVRSRDAAGNLALSGDATFTTTSAAVAPSITAQPTSVTVTAGQAATFSVSATGTATLTYQWRRNGAAIAGATSASYTTPVTTTGDSGAVFSVVVSNGAGSATSANATLTVDAAVATPYGGTARAIPGTIQCEDFDDGGEGLAYHDSDAGNDGGAYRSTDVDIRGSIDVGGGYQVGWFGAGEWMQYTCNAAAAGVFTASVRGANGDVGGTLHIAIDGVDVTGAIAFANTGGWDMFQTIGHAGIAISAGRHAVRLYCDTGAVDVNWIAFAVTPPPAISAQPTGATVTAPQTATFSVGATGTGALSYQWRRNGAAIAGATAASYTTPATSTADSGAVFTVVVSDLAGSTTSSGATLTVNPAPIAPPSITAQPASVAVTAGQTATFSVVASGGGTLTYQWRRNGTAIAGATSASYTTPATTTADSGAVFDVVVGDAGGSVTSVNATLIVNASTAPVATPYGGVARAIPGRIEAEDFDDGGEGVAYHDRDAGNNGGAYRATDVDIRTSIDSNGGGFQVGWFGGDEWMQYTTDAADAGSYTLTVRIANGDVGGTFHVTIDGVDATGPLITANTGGWDSFVTLSHGGIAIASGRHTVRIVSDSGAVDVNWFAFAAETTTSTGAPAGTTTTPSAPTTSVTGSTGSGGGCGRGAGLIAVGLALFFGGRSRRRWS